VALLAIATLPWFWEAIESIAFPGGSIRFRHLVEAQKHQAEEIQALQFLIKHLLTTHERAHLDTLAVRAEFPVGNAPEVFFNEMHHLRALEFVRGLPNKGVSSMRTEGGDVRNHFEITDVGAEYLRLVHAVQSTAGVSGTPHPGAQYGRPADRDGHGLRH